MQQGGRFGGHVVQVRLQGAAHQQRVGQVCDVDAHDGEGIAAGREVIELVQKWRLRFWRGDCGLRRWPYPMALSTFAGSHSDASASL